MLRELRLLVVEDSEDDAYLVDRILRRHGFSTVIRRVETAETMRKALQDEEFDLIISDYIMPQFTAMGALKVYHESGIDIPFIVISGSIGEDVAVEAMRQGVHDYMMKENLTRLGVTVDRELRDAQVRKERQRMAEGLSHRLRSLLLEARESQDLETMRQKMDAALQVIDELQPRLLRRKSSEA